MHWWCLGKENQWGNNGDGRWAPLLCWLSVYSTQKEVVYRHCDSVLGAQCSAVSLCAFMASADCHTHSHHQTQRLIGHCVGLYALLMVTLVTCYFYDYSSSKTTMESASKRYLCGDNHLKKFHFVIVAKRAGSTLFPFCYRTFTTTCDKWREEQKKVSHCANGDISFFLFFKVICKW